MVPADGSGVFDRLRPGCVDALLDEFAQPWNREGIVRALPEPAG